MTFVKICGITNLEDALAAVESGADALGFNFFEHSPRYISAVDARDIIDQIPPSIMSVGVFVNESEPERVARIADSAGLTALQLHGDESPEFCYALRGRFIIKAVRAGEDFDPSCATRYATDAILIDAYAPEAYGGTGGVVDWSLAKRLRDLVPRLLLAGGLSPENVSEAIASVEPYGVDACSRLESAPGKKDNGRVRAFVAAAHQLR